MMEASAWARSDFLSHDRHAKSKFKPGHANIWRWDKQMVHLEHGVSSEFYTVTNVQSTIYPLDKLQATNNRLLYWAQEASAMLLITEK